MNVFELAAKISLDTREYTKGLKDSGEHAKGFASKIGGGLKTASAIGIGAVSALSSAAVALTGAFIKGTSSVAQYGDNIDKMSQKMGFSAKAYQEWDFILQHSGSSMETLKASMKTLSAAADTNSDAFARLGISQEQVQNSSPEELFELTIKGLQGVENETERTALAGKLLGRGATELGALLNTSAEDIEAMKNDVHALGGVMSDEAVKAAAAFQDSLQNLKTSLSGITRGALSEFLPSMVKVMDGLSLLFSGQDGGVQKLSEGIAEFSDKLMENIPDFLDLALAIVERLGEAIIENLPTLTETATEVIFELADYLIENLPMLLETGLEILVTLMNGIAENLDQMMPTITDTIIQLALMLTDPNTLVPMIKAALKIIVALGKGLIKAIPELVKNVPTIIKNLVDTLIESVPEIAKAGGDLLKGLWKGISDTTTWLWNKVKGFAGDLVKKIKEFFGIKSPSKVFAGIGGFLAKGLGVGFDDEMDGVRKDMEKEMQFEAKPIEYSAVLNGVKTADVGASAMERAYNMFANMRLYLDGDTLVGGITDRVDDALGEKAIYQQRGVMV